MELTHPFILAHYELKTPDIRALIRQLRTWIFASIKGGMIIGEKRVGKSYAIRYVVDNIAGLLGHDCYAFRVLWKSTKHFNERRFWVRMLAATGYDTTLPGDADRLEQRFYQRIVLQCEDVGAPVCVLFLDDAQNITPDEFVFLCHAFNELESRGIRLYTWLVGQTELKHTRTLMQETGNGQIIARFMEHEFEMGGVASARTLKSLLRQLDNQGVTACAARKATDNGFVLASTANDVWSIKREVDKECGQTSAVPWTMQQFHSIIAIFVQMLELRDRKQIDVPLDELKKVIKMIQTRASVRAIDDASE